MFESSIRTRTRIVAVLVVAATVLLHASDQRTKTPLRKPLDDIPLVLGQWSGVNMPFTDRIIAAVGVDDYLNRAYTDSNGNLVEVYLGYYGSQRAGELIHSPKNCLPGAGWEWVRKGRLDVTFPGQTAIEINDFRITKGLKEELVLYWYQGRGRAVASEYTAKFWMVADAITRHRSDGSLVRLIVPIQDSETQARALGINLLRELYGHLKESIPD